MKHYTLILLLLAALLSACDAPQAVTKTKDGGYLVENGGTFFWKADAEGRDLDVTMKDGTHIAMHRTATKPDGTEYTKLWMYDSMNTLGKYAAHSTDIKTRTAAAPGIITAKGQAAVNLQNAKNAAPVASP